MRRQIRLVVPALVAALLTVVSVGGAAGAATNVLDNGSFEWPAPKHGAPSRQFEVGQHIGAWTVTVGPVTTTTANPAYETPPVGSLAVNLRPFPDAGDGEICQPVSGMVPGTGYKVRLLAASITESSTIDVTLGGAPVGHLDLPGTLPAVFKLYVWRITAATTDAVFCIHGHPTGSGFGFPIIDGVRIKPVPA